MFSDHQPTRLEKFRGYYARYGIAPNYHFLDDIPNPFLALAKNYEFVGDAMQTRPGINTLVDLDPAIGPILRMHRYQKINDSPRYLILDDSGKIFDTSSVTPGVPILEITGMVDFATQILFDRIYISPHNRIAGLEDEVLYVYDGSGTARAASGTKPSTSLSAVDGIAGQVISGKHLISYAFESASGAVTKYATPTLYTAPGSKKIALSGISQGPIGTVARYILMSPVITDYDGNPDNYELFFVPDPDGKIDDNIATTREINPLDSALLDSAEYLRTQRETIPAGVALCEHEGRLVVVGPFGQESVAYVSKPGEPESVHEISGAIICSPGDGGGLKNCLSHRGSLFFFKSRRTFVTSDTGGEPSSWPKPVIVDSALGTECSGIAELLDSRGVTRGIFCVLTDAGLYAFNGEYSENPLTYNIAADVTVFIGDGSEVLLDPIKNVIYLLLDNNPTFIYVGDFAQQLSVEGIRWTKWQFDINDIDNIAIRSIKIDPINGLVIASSNSQRLFKLDPTVAFDDVDRIIKYQIKFPFLSTKDGTVLHLDHVKVNMGRLFGPGSIKTLVEIHDASQTLVRSSEATIGGPKRSEMPEIGINVVAQKIQLTLSNGFDTEDKTVIDSIIFFSAPVWS